MDAPELAQRDGIGHVVCRIEPREDGMRALDANADAARVHGVGAEAQRVPDSAAVAAVDGFVRLGFHENQRVLVILEDGVHCVAQLKNLLHGVLALRAKCSFAGEPELNLVGAERLGDVAAALGAPDREIVVLLEARGVRAVVAARVEPETGRDKLGKQAVFVEHGLDVLGIVDDRLVGHVVHVRNGVVIMELNARHAEFGKLLDLLFQRNARTDARAKGLVAFVNVPGAYGKTKCTHNCSSRSC
ncbi:hypothetical protein SDC9_158345 [bioreactor metagenome]|uniref:Uncharacterized protein n=1 Tax=bioreactor metagenome TaxID=1076179 RepID=A0A645FEX0_9ZZZZ